MIDMTFMVEVAKRHWKALAAALVASTVLGACYSYLSSGTASVGKDTYTAELTVYVNGYEESAEGDFNYSLNEDYLINDCKRVMVSNSVAGEVRRQYGEDVKVRIPYWSNPYTTGSLYSHFFYVQVSGPTEQIALDAASEVARLGMGIIEEKLPVSEVFLYEGPILKNGADETTNYGIDDLDVVSGSSLTAAARSVSPKTVLVCAFCGLVLVYILLLANDYLRRRIRSKSDVERLMGVPVIDVVPAGKAADKGAYTVAALAIDSACKGDEAKKVALGSLGAGDALVQARKGLEGRLRHCSIDLAVDLSSDDEDLLRLTECDACALVVVQGAAGSQELAKASCVLVGAQVPTIGAIYYAK